MSNILGDLVNRLSTVDKEYLLFQADTPPFGIFSSLVGAKVVVHWMVRSAVAFSSSVGAFIAAVCEILGSRWPHDKIESGYRDLFNEVVASFVSDQLY